MTNAELERFIDSSEFVELVEFVEPSEFIELVEFAELRKLDVCVKSARLNLDVSGYLNGLFL